MNMHNVNMTQNDTQKDKSLDREDTIISDQLMEQQIARGISDLLTDRAQHLEPHIVQELLRARSAAVDYLVQHQTQYQTVPAMDGGKQAFGRLGHWVQHLEQRRMAFAVMALMMLVLLLFAMQPSGTHQNIENSDAFLLASDLPPEAYADKGFDAWIESN